MIRSWRATFLALGVAAALAPFVAKGGTPLLAVELSSHQDKTEIVLGLPRPVAFQVVIDDTSAKTRVGRLTVEFADLPRLTDGGIGRGQGLVRSYRAETMRGGGVRVIMDLARPATIVRVRALPAARGRAARAVVDLAASSARAMHAAAGVAFRPEGTFPAPPPRQRQAAIPKSIGALIDGADDHALALPTAPPPPTTSAVAAGESRATPPSALKPPRPGVAEIAPVAVPKIAAPLSPRRTIVIDAGHGGIDPGAESVAGYHEKEITLATARMLRRVLEQTGHYKVVLTRDADIYLKLRERVRLARVAHASLFISLHADSAPGGASTARGASIYTLSETASDAESERLAQRENRADAIGGVDLGDQADDVAGILVDLTVRETVNDGNRLAGMMVDSLQHQSVTLVPSNPHRSAGFAVLKSPDIPSVLIEMGYLSDMADARGLADLRHEQQIAKAIADGVDRYFTWVQTARS